MNWKLLLKRYLLPLVLVFIIYSLLYFIFDGDRYFSISLIMTIVYFYLVRLVDDYFDYEDDLANNKVLFSKKTINIFIYVLGFVFISLAIVFGYYYFLILLLLLYMGVIFKYFKVLFIPCAIFLIIFYNMNFNYIYFIISGLFIIGDFMLIRKE